MTIEEKAMAYADRYEAKLMAETAIRAYIAGTTEALASQWVSVDNELPKERMVVLCRMPDKKDKYAEDNIYYDVAVLLDGDVFLNPNADIIHPTHWMRIPPMKGGGYDND